MHLVFADVFGILVGIEQEQDVDHKVVDVVETTRFVFTSCYKNHLESNLYLYNSL